MQCTGVYLGNFGPEISETLLANISKDRRCSWRLRKRRRITSYRAAAMRTVACSMQATSELRNVKAYIPEYPVGTAEECADMIHEFEPIARAVIGLNDLKIISFGPRPLNFLACNAPIQQLYNLGVEIEENSELDPFRSI